MIRWFVGSAFQRWGIPGALCSLLFLAVLAWWVVTTFVWLVTGIFVLVGALAGVGYLLLLIFLIRWMRGRRSNEHLLEYGRRGWLD